MKNVSENQLVRCIVKPFDEFNLDVANAVGEGVSADYDFSNDEVVFSNGTCDLRKYEVLDKLSEYYGVYVGSVHVDGVDAVRVWIEYVSPEK